VGLRVGLGLVFANILLQLRHGQPLMFRCRVRVPKDHIELRMAQDSSQGRQIHP
jgi:hypothetical protein